MADRQDTPVKITDEPKSTASVGITEFPAGTLLGGRYRVISKCGQGGMGIVYKVEQIFAHKEMALKTLHGQELDEVQLRRFQQEARASCAVEHPNIIAVHDCGTLDGDGTPFLAMDFIEGMTLAQMIGSSGALSMEQAIAIFIPVCFGLSAAHRRGIVHRDMKPSNIMIVKDAELGAEGSVKIVDFGSAKLTQHEGGEIQALTRTGEIFGSPMYMSPEQCKGERVDHRADVYSLGCVLFEALAGSAPFISDSALTTMMQHISDPAPTLKEASLGRKFPQALEEIVAKMLAKAPEDRYQDLGVVAHELSNLGTGDRMPVDGGAPNRTGMWKRWGGSCKVTVSPGRLALMWLLTAMSFTALGGLLHHVTATNRPPQSASSDKPAGASHELDVFRTSPGDNAFDAMSFDKPSLFDERINALLSHPAASGTFNLTYSPITAAQMKRIAQAPWITGLDLYHCDISNESLSLFEKKQNLSTCNFKGSMFNDVGAECISHCSGMTALVADNSTLSIKGLTAIGRMKKLQTLELSETEVPPDGLCAISKIGSLQQLQLREISNFSSDLLAPLVHSRVRLLDLNENKKLDDHAIKYLRAMPELREVHLNGTMVSSRGISDLLRNSKVNNIWVVKCSKLHPEETRQLKRQFPSVHISAG